MNLFNFSPYEKYYGLTVLFVKTETTKPFFNDMFRLLICIFDMFYPGFSSLANFGKTLRIWTKLIILEK